MGKHTLHGITCLYCDWTGLPLVASDAVRWTKLGSSLHFLNYNCMLAYAKASRPDKYESTRKWVLETTGLSEEAPSYKELKHFGGSMSVQQFSHECEQLRGELDTLLVKPDGTMHVAIVDSNYGSWDVTTVLKGKGLRSIMMQYKNHKLVFFFVYNSESSRNECIFKKYGLVTHGDTLIARVLKKTLGSYTIEDFKSHTPPKRKTPAPDQSTQAALQESSSAFESRASSRAVAVDQERVRKVARVSGREVAAVARAKAEEEEAAGSLLAMTDESRSGDGEGWVQVQDSEQGCAA